MTTYPAFDSTKSFHFVSAFHRIWLQLKNLPQSLLKRKTQVWRPRKSASLNFWRRFFYSWICALCSYLLKESVVHGTPSSKTPALSRLYCSSNPPPNCSRPS
ncbi:hypothetical protein BO83DRAFT_243252 [Aspergillus eucalypticola CBS 122712]|uniref:Uncharacterized protein n=1 Tax=Aspergillus eucalypticola (strain CBS 122712 / IBT 29274) TaxID=1448314 RepID=A0A317VNP9_ASPEC|nr:uncharacterized protein BO83DRAFT_243252 [Aspergillus eucalypticola CBS 122712]PWY75555.1 hypothetical protein BO83DRAFT_243252 [Aspergillus eucalypticola CBS 122712]